MPCHRGTKDAENFEDTDNRFLIGFSSVSPRGFLSCKTAISCHCPRLAAGARAIVDDNAGGEAFRKFLPTMRAEMSVPPPAVKGTIKRIGLAGSGCACACVTTSAANGTLFLLHGVSNTH